MTICAVISGAEGWEDIRGFWRGPYRIFKRIW
ncbi:hypothetical protein CHD36_02960 [Salmonella enterica]|nr:hypothetical protein CHD36_02960 [Salmonella enterica]